VKGEHDWEMVRVGPLENSKRGHGGQGVGRDESVIDNALAAVGGIDKCELAEWISGGFSIADGEAFFCCQREQSLSIGV